MGLSHVCTPFRRGVPPPATRRPRGGCRDILISLMFDSMLHDQHGICHWQDVVEAC